MAHPEDFGGPCGLLAISFMVAGSLYTFLGFVGYIKYGKDVKASITLNLPQNEP